MLLTDTTWRDAHQSLLATRMRTYDMLKVRHQCCLPGPCTQPCGRDSCDAMRCTCTPAARLTSGRPLRLTGPPNPLLLPFLFSCLQVAPATAHILANAGSLESWGGATVSHCK